MRTHDRKDPARAASVLRDVFMHPAPHALQRPGALVAAALAKVQSHLGVNRAEAATERLDANRMSETYRCGFAEGRAEGVAAGREIEALEARESLQSGADEARRQGFDEGREEGLRQGQEEAHAEAARMEPMVRQQAEQALKALTQQLDQVLASLLAEAHRQRALAEEDMVALSFEALCRIVGKQAASAETVTSMIRHLLAQHGQRSQLAVHVHPGDFAMLESAQSRGTRQSWRFVADDTVQLGGVVLRSPDGSLDARLEIQLAQLRETLVNTRNERSAALRQEPDEPTPTEEAAS